MRHTKTIAARLIDQVLPKLSGLIEALFSVTRAMPMLGRCTGPLVSRDLRGLPETLIICLEETSMAPSVLLRTFDWCENGDGFSNRMLDMAWLIARFQ